MATYYLAVDIGASSGRHILGWKEGGTLKTEEVYRFENGMTRQGEYLSWDTKQLFYSILEGMGRCRDLGKIPVSMGIDTWGVDYVLLDKEDRMLGQAVGYRDKRTTGMDDKVSRLISPQELYQRTGIQKQIFNTVYQLAAVKEQHPEYLEEAQCMLLVPDYFHFLLTGERACEYTEATTGQLVSPVTKDWDWELLERLGYPKRMFQRLVMPGTKLGELLPKIQEQVGYNCQVVLPATHDTGSAVLSVPSLQKDFLYISSGTWSLMGTERWEADCSPESQKANFTNEGGYEYRFRYLKNIMGLWMIQSVKKELDNRYDFGELCSMAEENKDFAARVDVDDSRFLSPDSMIETLKEVCREKGGPIPETPGELAAVIYQSLADCYGRTAREIEERTGKSYDCIYIVGGGSNADYLNRLTARAAGKTVCAGPKEATAVGNLLVQMLEKKEFVTLEEARECVYKSFGVKVYEPDGE